MGMGAVNDVTEEALRDLAQIRAREQTVLSLYLDLDPAWFATAPARATEIDSLLDGAHREVEAGERPHRERQELRRALTRAREVLEEDRSQARYQRWQYEGAEAHLRRAARMLHDLLRVSPYDSLLIACTAPLWPRVAAKLHADVRERLHSDRLSLDVGDASVEDVLRAAAP